MNENINLTKILKYCPKGYKLYTPLSGEVEFEGIIYGKFSIVVTDEFRNIYFTEKGLYYDAPNAECLLFPSKEQRDWSKFTAPWLEKQGKPNPYSGVSFKYNGHTWGMCARDNGVEILVDGEIKERIFLDNKPRGKSALEAIKEEKVDNANKVEPEFKVGDWITFYGVNPFKILKIESEINGVLDYLLLDQNGHDFYFNKTHVDKNARLWTIQDAKDGDVLFTSSTASHETFIFKSIDEKGNAECYFAYDSEDGFREGKYHFIGRATNCKPATKEQRDLLFQKMKEAGYEWDADKKELKKLVLNRFDPKTLKPFDKVLVRDDETCIWKADFYSHKGESRTLPFKCVSLIYKCCIPYNEDTKHLVGTKEEAPECYRYWED